MAYIDTSIMRTPYWGIYIEGKRIPVELERLLVNVSTTGTLRERDYATLTFINEGYIITNFRSKENSYLFAKNRKVDILIGYKDLHQAFNYVIDSIETSYPKDGLPQVNMKLLDVTTKYDKLNCKNKSYTGTFYQIIKQLGDENGFGVIVDVIEKDYVETFTSINKSYFQLLRQISQTYGYRFKIKDKTLVFRLINSVVLDTPNEPRYNLYYKMGDNSITSFKAKTKRTKRGKKSETAKLIGVLNFDTGQSTALTDEELDGTIYEETAETGVFRSEAPKSEAPKGEFVYIYGKGQSSEIEAQFTTELEPKQIEVIQEDAQNKEEAAHKLTKQKNTAKKDYDATIDCTFVDPFLYEGVKITCNGLDFRDNGIYIIVEREISMSKDSRPKLILRVNKSSISKPKKEEVPKVSNGEEAIPTDVFTGEPKPMILRYDYEQYFKDFKTVTPVYNEVKQEKSEFKDDSSATKSKPKSRQ